MLACFVLKSLCLGFEIKICFSDVKCCINIDVKLPPTMVKNMSFCLFSWIIRKIGSRVFPILRSSFILMNSFVSISRFLRSLQFVSFVIWKKRNWREEVQSSRLQSSKVIGKFGWSLLFVFLSAIATWPFFRNLSPNLQSFFVFLYASDNFLVSF